MPETILIKASKDQISKGSRSFNGILHGFKYVGWGINGNGFDIVDSFRVPTKVERTIYTILSTLAGVAVGTLAFARIFIH